MRISDWGSDVCSSDLRGRGPDCPAAVGISQNANDFQLLGDAGAGTVELRKEGWTFGETEMALAVARDHRARVEKLHARDGDPRLDGLNHGIDRTLYAGEIPACGNDLFGLPMKAQGRSVEHASELQSLMRISCAVFCL